MNLFIQLTLLVNVFFSINSQEANAQVSAFEFTVDTSKSNWAYTGFSVSGWNLSDVNNGGADLGAYAYFAAHYFLGNGHRIVFRLPFNIGTAGYDNFNRDDAHGAEFMYQDPIIGYSNNNLMMLPGEIDVLWEIRAYLPFSQASRDSKQILRLRNDFIFSKAFSRRIELEYWPKFSYYYQSNTTYIDPNGNLNNTKVAELDHWFTLWYKYSRGLNFGWQLGGENEWFNSTDVSPEAKKQQNGNLARHLIKTGPSLRFTVTDSVSFIATLSNKIRYAGFGNQNGEFADFGSFRMDQTDLSLLGFYSFN